MYAPTVKMTPVEAYDRWAETYDAQADNVVLALESAVFAELLARIHIAGRSVIDIGCGTGRHWTEILSRSPAEVVGIDPSLGMLERLRSRYPAARTLCAEGDRLTGIADASYGVIVSTLALAHMPDAARAIYEWFRILRRGGAMLITDVHPDAIRAGMKRTFVTRGKTMEIEHFATELRTLREIAVKSGLTPVFQTERLIDESVRSLYERADYLDAYNKHMGLPLVFGMHFEKPS